MFFTQEDYRKIEKWLLQSSMKDTDFVEAAVPLKGNETIVLVQNGRNVKTSVKDIVNQLFLLGVNDFLNITDKYNASYISLAQAISLIPSRSRKIGQVITFLNAEGKWSIYQFQGERVNQWNNETLWVDLISQIEGVQIIDSEDIVAKVNSLKQTSLTFADKNYSIAEFSGLGRVYLRKNIVNVENPSTGGTITINYLTQQMVSKENTIYIIQYDYNLNNAILTIPQGCVLKFEGGTVSNGSINLNGASIIAGDSVIFNKVVISNIAPQSVKAVWFGMIPDNLGTDCAPIIETYLKGITSEIKFEKGNYYFSELYIDWDDFYISGKSTNLASETIFLPFAPEQRYIIKLGGGRNTFGETTPKIRKPVIKGISFKGDSTKRMINNTASLGEYECGLLCVDRVEIGYIEASFSNVYDVPALYLGYIYEVNMPYISLYQNHVKSACPAIYFGSKSGDISATSIGLLQTEVLCGPIMKQRSSGSISELTIDNIFYEGSLEWEADIITDVQENYFNTDLETKIQEYNDIPKIGLFQFYNANISINNIICNRLATAKWKNTLDNDNVFKTTEFFYFPADMSSTNIDIKNVSISTSPFFYFEDVHTSAAYRKSVNIGSLSGSSGYRTSDTAKIVNRNVVYNYISPTNIRESVVVSIKDMDGVTNMYNSALPFDVELNAENSKNLFRGVWIPNVGNSAVVINADYLTSVTDKTYINKTLISQNFRYGNVFADKKYIPNSFNLLMLFTVATTTSNFTFNINYYNESGEIIDTDSQIVTTSSTRVNSCTLLIDKTKGDYFNINFTTINGYSLNIVKIKAFDNVYKGTTAQSSLVNIGDDGHQYFDTTSGRYIYLSERAWVNGDGTLCSKVIVV